MTTTFQLSLTPQTAQLHDLQTGALWATIEAGPQTMTELHFGRSPLGAGALERAIEWTEDRIQQARIHIPAGSRLVSDEADIRELGELAGLQGDSPLLYVDAVEQLFSRLVLQAFGRSAQQQNLPDSPRVFATVVLLREMLHHLHFEHIQLGSQGQPT